MNKNHKKFIENLKYYRNQKNMTQEDLAEQCNVSAGTISNIETGNKKPSFDMIFLLAGALHVNPYKLFFWNQSSDSEVIETDIIKPELLSIINDRYLKGIRSFFEMETGKILHSQN